MATVIGDVSFLDTYNFRSVSLKSGNFIVLNFQIFLMRAILR
jgi:hypothetical protein